MRLRLLRAEREFRAVLAERNRIAREVHDTLAQGYVGVSVQLEVVSELLRSNKTVDAVKHLDTTRQHVREGLAEARQSIWALRSQDSGENTLPVKLRRATELANGRGVEATFSLFGAFRPMPPRMEMEFLRVGQEAIHNVKKHAGATIFLFSLNTDRPRLHLKCATMAEDSDERRIPAAAGSLWPDGNARARRCDRRHARSNKCARSRHNSAFAGNDAERGKQRIGGVMAAQETIRVLVVEDHHVVRQGLVALLNVVDGIEVVGEAADGVEAIAQFSKCQPNVTLIDLRMPRLCGVEVIQRIRMETPQARFIVLTTYDGDEDIFRALQAGARAYLLKGMTTDELVSTIRTVHAGRSHIPPAIAQRLAERVGTEELTPREFDVLEQIVRGKSNKEIATELDISEATVKTHINSLLGKLGVTDRTQAATAAIQRGIVPLESLRKPKA